MITVHHLNNSRSQRILWLLEELGLEYRVQRYQRDAKTMRAPDSLKQVHPLGKSPVITDGDTVVAESGAIVEYLTTRVANGKLVPAVGSHAELQYRYWLHFAEGSLMTPLMLNLVFGRLTKPPVPWIMRPIAGAIAAGVKTNFINPEIKALLGHVDTTLEKSKWFAGDKFSAADVQMSFPLELFQVNGLLDSQYPATLRFLELCQARPAYQAALERGGQYDLNFDGNQ